jgi:hypothetical protein
MAVHVITQFNGNPEDDIITRQRREHQSRIDATDTYKTEIVHTEIGPKAKVQVVVRYAVNGQFLFATYQDNPAFFERPAEEWALAAKRALEKFVAMRGEQMVRSVKVEDLNPMSYMAEVRGALR